MIADVEWNQIDGREMSGAIGAGRLAPVPTNQAAMRYPFLQSEMRALALGAAMRSSFVLGN
jgi:hypothetical protein